MSFIENAVARWAELQRLQASPGWKLTNANAWVPALFREAFTRTRPRVPLDDFHAMTDSFLNRLRMDGVQLRRLDLPKLPDGWVTRRFLARPRADEGSSSTNSPNPPPASSHTWTATSATECRWTPPA